MDLVIRDASEADYSSWRILWDQYLVFYEATVRDGHALLVIHALLYYPGIPVQGAS